MVTGSSSHSLSRPAHSLHGTIALGLGHHISATMRKASAGNEGLGTVTTPARAIELLWGLGLSGAYRNNLQAAFKQCATRGSGLPDSTANRSAGSVACRVGQGKANASVFPWQGLRDCFHKSLQPLVRRREIPNDLVLANRSRVTSGRPKHVSSYRRGTKTKNPALPK